MKHIELMCELMASAHRQDVINKKAALDAMMKPNAVTYAQANKLSKKITTAINRIKKIFPKLHQTRFNQLSDFYSLVVLMLKFEDEKLILNNKRRNRLAWELLVAFSNGVDEVRLLQKKAIGIPPRYEKNREYLLTVIHNTDEYQQRKHREEILRGLLATLFVKKDDERIFSPEQRRILWNSTSERKCKLCKKPVTWADFSVDHIKPFSKGGQTQLNNAAIMHKSCNSSKGNR